MLAQFLPWRTKGEFVVPYLSLMTKRVYSIHCHLPLVYLDVGPTYLVTMWHVFLFRWTDIPDYRISTDFKTYVILWLQISNSISFLQRENFSVKSIQYCIIVPSSSSLKILSCRHEWMQNNHSDLFSMMLQVGFGYVDLQVQMI